MRKVEKVKREREGEGGREQGGEGREETRRERGRKRKTWEEEVGKDMTLILCNTNSISRRML